MSIKKQVEDTFGLEAFKAAMRPQEGSFHRAATLILNEPKDQKVLDAKPARRDDNETVARALLDRNAKGQFVAAKEE